MRTFDDKSPPDEGVCLNCQKDWGDHGGWSCSGYRSNRKGLSPNNQYLSHRMYVEENVVTRDSGLPDIEPMAAIQVKPDLTDWKAWRDINRQSDECPCGIHRSQCRYH